MNGKTIALAEKTRNGGYVYAGVGKLNRHYGDGGGTATGVADAVAASVPPTDSIAAKAPWEYPKLHPQLIIAKTATDGVRARAMAEYDRRVNEYNALNAAVNKVVNNGREAASRSADKEHLGYAQQEAPSLDENRMVGGRDVFAMHNGGIGFNARWLPKREAILNKNARDAGIELDPDNPMLNVEMWNMMRPRFNTTPDGRARIFREQPGGTVVTGGFTAFPTGVSPERFAYGIEPAGSYYYSPDVTEFPETTGVHEAAHGLGHNKPQEIVIEKRGIKPVRGGSNAYIDKPTEIYSRLQELRSHYNLDPQSVQNDEDIQKLKADAAASGHGFDILNRYSDEDIKFLLNDVAMNRMLPGRTDPYMMSPPSGVEAQGRHLAANGGFLRRYDGGGEVPDSTRTPSSRVAALVQRINETSNADFVRRLLGRNRKTLDNEDGTVSTHELGYVTDADGNATVFPQVQSADSGNLLMRVPYPMSYYRAAERGDTVRMSVPDAEAFTSGYKNFYPGFDEYACGGLLRRYDEGGQKPVGTGADAASGEAQSVTPISFYWNGALPGSLYVPQSVPDYVPVPYSADGYKQDIAEKQRVQELAEKKAMAVDDIIRRLKVVENKKTDPNGGWDAKHGVWRPHKSKEGGAKTIGYGCKLSNGTKWAKLAESQGYLTDEEANAAVTDMSQEYYDRARIAFDRMLGAGSWDRLPWKAQSILTDYEYNSANGLRSFPKMSKAIYDGDIDKAKSESSRHSNGKPLTERNTRMLEELDEFGVMLSDDGK